MNLKALGLLQVNKYWRFLLAAGLYDDINQEIDIAIWKYPNDLKDFSRELNRGLYQIARAAGFRKLHMDEHVPGTNWWQRPALSFQECQSAIRSKITKRYTTL